MKNKLMNSKKGFGFLIPLIWWALIIYLGIGIIIFLWAGISVGWWTLQNLLMWPLTFYQVGAVFGGGYI